MARTATRLLSVVGARPQFVKLAVICRALRSWLGVHHTIVHTGQHYHVELSDTFFQELAIPTPSYHLGVAGGSHGDMTGRMLVEIEPVIVDEGPTAVLVFGDTNSTLVGALASAKLGIPVVHIEAGLRSFDRRMPEEVNRVLTDHLSELLLCPTPGAVSNLRREGIHSGIYHVGDVMYDVALATAKINGARPDILERFGVSGRPFVVLTLHRAENTDSREQLVRLLSYVKEEARSRAIVFPVHPRTKAAVSRFDVSLEGFITCHPLGYLDMVRLVRASATVYTDSGGLQKEAYFHRVPCVTLRESTEWTELVRSGWNRLWRNEYIQPRVSISDYGNGNAGRCVVEILRNTYG